ncbi:hypothetical protein QQY66_11505 [Streptomyces sp. DG2A-72]|uniref:hypothetical protein n=1 Tax=Streptomyces sp. DG2A-72 TaxID=3051386 RepID=UPI00265B8EB3|nr:hypothetical protein [Streptomyces sp. DG2A-72]MDO0932282.1 hypothetical protein [Streptomyces sp. DG2A-72]
MSRSLIGSSRNIAKTLAMPRYASRSSMAGHHAWVIARRTSVVDAGEAADIPRTVAH